ncbi:MAG: hypothetical protein PHW14_03875 [Candidatus Omnitrophica bacterium]|nr:hypothetical protein [Candidatus Omnitrophota bacterium]
MEPTARTSKGVAKRARIRSVHPEQWTDDEFVQMTPYARLLALAVRNLADDNGVFEANPVKLKMRCLAYDNVDVAALLEEMEAHRQVHLYDAGGRRYGLIRNFAQFQNPKKPSFVYPTPSNPPDGYELHPEYRAEVQNEYGTSSELVPNQFGTFPPKERRGVGVGGEKEETAKSPDAPPSAPPPPPTERDAAQAPPTASPAAHDEGQLSIAALEPRSMEAAPANGTAKRESAPPPDPLEPYPVLAAYWPDLWQSVKAAHPREGPPKPGSQADRKARDAIAKLVHIDGYPEAEVVEVLRWVFEADDRQAEFWRGVVLSPASLRTAKGGDGVTKFAKIYAQWQRRQPAAIIASHWEGDPDDIF